MSKGNSNNGNPRIWKKRDQKYRDGIKQRRREKAKRRAEHEARIAAKQATET